MKQILLFLFLLSPPLVFAQTDTMFVELTSGTIKAYAIPTIREITFPGLTSVKEQELMQNVLTSFTLKQNYPNPFNPSTTIQYSIPATGDVKIDIYDIQGRVVRSFEKAVQQAGTHSIVWDSRNNFGNTVSSGTYFYRVQFKGSQLVNKLLLLK